MTEREQVKRSGLGAIVLERSRTFAASPEQVYAVLADPNGLERLLPRVSRVQMQSTGAQSANLTTWMRFPVAGEVRTEGELHWEAPKEVVYRSKSTLPVMARWAITPLATGSQLTATLDLDLVPLLGPMAAFVPEHAVKDVMARELDKALDAVAAQVG
jgi:carbon monoxide dehydrogenase subunit G